MPPETRVTVRGTEILPTDSRQHFREKIARITLDSMGQLTALLDTRGTLLEINQLALDTVGIPLSEIEGKPFWTTRWWQASPEIHQGLRNAITRAAAGEVVRWDTEIPDRAPGRDPLLIDASLTPVFDDGGQVVFLCFEGRDITREKTRERELARKDVEIQTLLERVRHLERTHTPFFSDIGEGLHPPLDAGHPNGEETAALKASEERYRAFATASSDVIYQMSADWSELRHLQGREFIADTLEPSQTWLEKYIHPADQRRVTEAIQEAVRTRTPFHLEHRVLRVDGTLGWTSSRAIPVVDREGELIEWIGTASDITPRWNAEAALQQQRRLYEAILTNTPDLAYVFDREHRFIYANDGLLKMWGRTWQEAMGKTCLELGYEPWHAEMHNREIDQVVATRRPIRGEVPFEGTFGRRIYDYIFVPVFGPEGEVEAVAGTTRDVTERKEEDRRKDEFLATLAHELRNPLAPIRSSIQVLSLSSQEDETTQEVCEIMQRQVDLMVRLVDDLLEISRITRGTIELRQEPTTLVAIVQNAIDTSRPVIEGSGHELVLGLPAEPVAMFGDAVRLSQVVSNLLNNAAKYTDRSGRIELCAEATAAEVVIRVRDNGIGIPAEALPRVFDMFMQVERSSLRGQGGLGIGLTLVKRLVEMHGGEVSVHSEGPGRGSEFVVRLPKTMQPPVARTISHATTSSSVRRRPVLQRVLVVDDNRDAAQSLAMLLRMLGGRVQVAHDGPGALASIEEECPDVAFLDIGMPGMDGFEVARRMRRIEGRAKVVLVALTGWGQLEDRQRTSEAGFDHHLVKPVSMSDLESLLSTIAGR